MRNDLSFETEVNELDPQQDFVSYKKPMLGDAQVHKKTLQNQEQLLNNNKDAFVEHERQVLHHSKRCLLILLIIHQLQKGPTQYHLNIMTGSEKKLTNYLKQ